MTLQGRGLALPQHSSTGSPRSAPVLRVPGCYPFLPHLWSHLVQVYYLGQMGDTDQVTVLLLAQQESQKHQDRSQHNVQPQDSLDTDSLAPLSSLPAWEAIPPVPGSLSCGRWDRSRRTGKKHRHSAHPTLTTRASQTLQPLTPSPERQQTWPAHPSTPRAEDLLLSKVNNLGFFDISLLRETKSFLLLMQQRWEQNKTSHHHRIIKAGEGLQDQVQPVTEHP